MRVAHASDTHADLEIITGVADVACDIILLTGDILGNAGRLYGQRIDPRAEIKYQRRWARKAAKKWAPAFKGRDVIYVEGNHDFVDIGPFLRRYGHPPERLHHITDLTPLAIVQGVRFAGFRQIPWIDGEWAGETPDLRPHVDRALECDPDVLVTHAPPGGILDGGVEIGYGIPYLTSRLMFSANGVKAHFFGHAHERGGESIEKGGIVFVNGACGLAVHEVET